MFNMIEELKLLKPGKLTEVTVMHDDWCRYLRRKGPCNCNPEIKVGAPQSSV